MNTFRMLRMMCSKFFVQEILFAIMTCFIVVCLLASLVPVTNIMVQSDAVEEAFSTDGGSLIYCTPFPSAHSPTESPTQVTPTEILKNDTRLETLYQSQNLYSYMNMGIDEKGQEIKHSINCIVYSSSLASALDSVLSEGDFDSHGNTDAIPVVISKSFTDQYDIGDYFDVNIEVNGTSKERRCLVTGILASDAIIISIGSYSGSYIYIDAIQVTMQEMDMLSDGSSDFIICAAQNLGIEDDELGQSGIFSIKDGFETDEIISDLTKTYDLTMRFDSYDNIITNSLTKALQNNRKQTLNICLLSIVLVFSFVGYIVLNFRQKSRLYAVFYMCGMSRIRSLLLNMMYIGLIAVPALLIGLWYASIYIRAEQSQLMYIFYGFNNYIYFAIVTFFVVLLLLSVLLSHLRIKQAGIISQYREI